MAVHVHVALVDLGHGEPRLHVHCEVLHAVGVVTRSLQALVQGGHGLGPLPQAHQQVAQLQLQHPVATRHVDGLVVVVNGPLVVVCGDEGTCNLTRQLRVLGGVLQGALKRLDRLLRLQDLHERLAQHAVGVIVSSLVHQVQVALDVGGLVLAVAQVDVGHSHASLCVVRAGVGDLAQLLERALHITARNGQLRVRHRDANLLTGTLKLADGVRDVLLCFRCVRQLAEPAQNLRQQQVDGGALVQSGLKHAARQALPLLRAQGGAHARQVHGSLQDLSRLLHLSTGHEHLGVDNVEEGGLTY
mmetsp:Transcript_21966/g.47939  ORF Transcript_21966/g.47939 Transcript_21966/m.47939 type:complete len:302 (+) Transcript_21966:1918-2823(+)